MTVPILAEVLERFPHRRFNIDIRQAEPSIAEPLCQLLKDKGRQQQTLVASFHGKAVNEFRKVCPEVATSAKQVEITAFLPLHMIGLPGLHHPRAHALQVPLERFGIELTDAARIAFARRLDPYVDAWTLNDESSISSAVGRGVTGIITDNPDVAIKVRQSLRQTASLRNDGR